jgi:hypothetical protein
VDAPSIILQSVTELTAALALLLSRLDARRRRASESFDERAGLHSLFRSIEAWHNDALMTDRSFQQWVEGHIDESSAIYLLKKFKDHVKTQGKTADQALALIRGDSNLRPLLSIYGPELLAVMDSALAGRRELIDGLVGEIPNLKKAGLSAMQAASMKLRRASKELGEAVLQVSVYVRTNYPRP